MNGYCSIHKSIETGLRCFNCYKSWPKEKQSMISRPMCKRKNWVGRSDVNYENSDLSNRIDIPEVIA